MISLFDDYIYLPQSHKQNYGIDLDKFTNVPLTKNIIYEIEYEIKKFLNHKLSIGEIYDIPNILIFSYLNKEVVIDVFYDSPSKRNIEKLNYLINNKIDFLSNIEKEKVYVYLGY